MKSNLKAVAFVATMGALANVLGLLTVQIGIVNVHFSQLPVIFSGLSLGPVPGAAVGALGFLVSSFMLPAANPYVIGGNAILGFFTGLFYVKVRRIRRRPIVPQIVAVVLAYLVQAPYVFLTDVYLMAMPVPIVLAIMAVLLVEDLTCVFFCHAILYRVDMRMLLSTR